MIKHLLYCYENQNRKSHDYINCTLLKIYNRISTWWWIIICSHKSSLNNDKLKIIIIITIVGKCWINCHHRPMCINAEKSKRKRSKEWICSLIMLLTRNKSNRLRMSGHTQQHQSTYYFCISIESVNVCVWYDSAW